MYKAPVRVLMAIIGHGVVREGHVARASSKAGALGLKGWTDRGRLLLTGSPRALTAQETPSRTTAPPQCVGLQRGSLVPRRTPG